MKKTLSRLNDIIASVLSGILVLLGFSACSDNDDDNNIQCMYGTPTGHYEIKGSVTDKNDTPVEDATIILRSISKDGISTLYPGIKTDSEGKYSLLASGWPTSKIRVVCHPKGDTLEADSTEIEVKLEGGTGMWNQGTAKADVDFKLKDKPTQNDDE